MNATDDWYDVRELGDGAWSIFEGIFGSFLIAGEDRALVIDAGAGVGDLRGMAEELVDVPVTLLLTHTHWDHVVNAPQFDDVLADPREHDDGRADPNPFNYGPEDWVADWRAAGREFPDEFDPDEFELSAITGIESIEPGTTIDLGGTELDLLAVPGHSPGQLAALDREVGALYAGDVIHRDRNLWIHFDGCDVRDYLDTFETLIDLRDAGTVDTIHFAHTAPISGDDLSVLDEYRDGLAAVLDDDLPYEEVDEGIPARRYEIAGSEVLTKPDVS